jgi:hypothetical protein
MTSSKRLKPKDLQSFRASATFSGSIGNINRDRHSIHAVYRYPARFSPRFARAAIELYSSRGEMVIDPFCGGGTTGLEATLMGRQAFCSDLSPLAVFLAEAKSSFYTVEDYGEVESWAERCVNFPITELWKIERANPIPSVHVGPLRQSSHIRIRAALAAWTNEAELLENGQALARLCLLRVGQRFLDLRRGVPALVDFRKGLLEAVDQTVSASLIYQEKMIKQWGESSHVGQTAVYELPISEIEFANQLKKTPPKLAVFSPPYPGVHVLYPKWQVQGRRETSVPFWIAGVEGATTEATYTMGRRGLSNTDEFMGMFAEGMNALANVMADGGHVVQMVGFKDPSIQLKPFLQAMSEAGFKEQRYTTLATRDDKRLWREVPGQKWYNAVRSQPTHTSHEVVLIHRLV